MSYFVLCTFDLKDADYEDYKSAYSALEKFGMKKVVISSDGKDVIIPTTTVAGKFTGQSVGSVRTYVCDKVQKLFSDLNLKSEVFVLAAGDWGWGGRKT